MKNEYGSNKIQQIETNTWILAIMVLYLLYMH